MIFITFRCFNRKTSECKEGDLWLFKQLTLTCKKSALKKDKVSKILSL